ncbi:MAG: 2Fe-2S iron-sulfur cluster-binding protein [Thermoplasmata archaeon]|nr:2Fe-2S iron-sulfur cluster-binding protein [Thermoplasmata archaeon]MCI4359618.1 2Fe-2S iron-sulfur cluster-binding protein [Thermoplasmata archaeon]
MSEGPSPWVRYRGRPVPVRPGDTLARALARRGVGILGRSVRYHRPRSPFCGIGFCTNCLVRVNGRPNVRACRYRPTAQDAVESENAWPSPRFDLLGLIDRVFPSGIDTLHGFNRPRWAVPAYQWVVRRLAGYGTLADEASGRSAMPGEERTMDLVVVGGGTAGGGFARSLGPGAGRTLLVERERSLEAIPRVEVLDQTTVVFLPPPDPTDPLGFRLLAARDDGRGVRIRARQVVVAVGGYDAGLLFSGNDRPGVMTADGAEGPTPETDRPSFHHAVLFGDGARIAGLLERWGDRVEAIVAPGSIGPEVARRSSELGIPLYPRTLLLEAIGTRRVRAVRLARRGTGESVRLPCDAVVIAHRRLPHPQLFFQAGARMEWRSETGSYYPTLSDRSETTVPGLFAIGESAGFVGSAASSSAEGLAAVLSGPAPARTGSIPRVRSEGSNELEGYYRELLPKLPKHAKTIACACEDVLLSELVEASERGYRGIEVTKRYTGIGTGLCQGRYCLPDAILLLSLWEGRPPNEVGYITQRPPVVPTPLTALAGLPPPTRTEPA